jgi:small subunit ribosomal protein S21
MSQVTARNGESFENLLKRFKRACERDGILADLRKHEYFEKPSIKKKRKQAAARKREAKRREDSRPNSKLNFRFNSDKTKKIYQKPQPRTNNNYNRRPRD